MKSLLRKLLYLLYPRLTKGASILMYHSVATNNGFFTVHPGVFEKQMHYLKNSGYTIIPLSELVDRFLKKEDMSSCVSVTFDDGYVDNLENVLPVLQKYQINATMFIAPELLGKPFTTSDGVTLDIFSLEDFHRKNGFSHFELLSHALSHKELPTLSSKEVGEELQGSLLFLQNVHPTKKILAYPRGKFSKEVLEVVSEEKWDAAVTTLPGLVTRGSNPLLLPRNFVGRDTTFAEFKTLVSDSVYYYAKVKSWYTDFLKKS